MNDIINKDKCSNAPSQNDEISKAEKYAESG